MLDALGDVRGLRIMELGCGDGQLARTVLSVSCRSYAGIDNSARMVAAAREALTGTEAVVTQGDIAAFSAAANSYDLVVSCMALHYVADLQAVLDACRACLSPGGRVLFSVVHPVITSHETPSDGAKRTSWLVDDYFEPGPRERDWMGSTVVWHHRTVEAHVTALVAAGFTLDALRECAPRRELFRGDDAEYARRQRVPLFLLLAGSVS